MEYFKKLSVKTPPQTIIDCPIRIQEIAILQDSFDKNTLGRIKFVNQSKKNIIAVFFDLSAKDISGEPVDLNNKSFIYQDMSVEPGELYGNKIAIDLPDAVRIFSAEINRIVFEDGTVWKASDAETCPEFTLEQIDLPQENYERIRDELTKIIPDVDYINYYYQKNGSAWLCSCGKINFPSNKICSFCGCAKSSQEAVLTKEHFATFCDNINLIVEKEKEEATRKAKEEKQRREEEYARREKERQERQAEEERKQEIKREAEQKKSEREKGILAFVIIIALIALIVRCISYNNNIQENEEIARRNIYESAEEMKGDLQGRYHTTSGGNIRYIEIDGDTLTRTSIDSNVKGIQKEDDDIIEWDFSKGTFTASSDVNYIALADGNIEVAGDGHLFEKE